MHRQSSCAFLWYLITPLLASGPKPGAQRVRQPSNFGSQRALHSDPCAGWRAVLTMWSVKAVLIAALFCLKYPPVLPHCPQDKVKIPQPGPFLPLLSHLLSQASSGDFCSPSQRTPSRFFLNAPSSFTLACPFPHSFIHFIHAFIYCFYCSIMYIKYTHIRLINILHLIFTYNHITTTQLKIQNIFSPFLNSLSHCFPVCR